MSDGQKDILQTIADVMPGTAKHQPKKRVFEAGPGRRLVFIFLFLLLLPFFASLGPMLYARLSHGAWTGTLGLLIIAACFFVVMFFIVTELLFSLRTKVVFKDDSVKLTVPAGNGPTPMFRYHSHDVPFADIARVESYRELYGGAITPVVLKGSRIIKKDGTQIPLGFVSEANVDPSLPIPEIASRIADCAGIEVTDCGCMRHKLSSRVLGLVPTPENGIPIEDFNLKKTTRQHYVVVAGLVLGLGFLVALGIFIDLVNSNTF